MALRKWWLEFDPFRRPSWRWDMAGRIASGELPRHRSLDDALRAAIAFRRYHEPSEALPDRQHRRGPRDQAIAAALALYQENGPRRWEVEARVLADQLPEEIAARCGLSLGAINAYESQFFDCRRSHNAWAWIAAQVLGSGLQRGFENDELDRAWATLGFFGGPRILDAAIAAFRACGEQPTIAAHLAPDSGVAVEVQAVLAGLVLPRSEAVDLALLPLQLGLLEVQAARDSVRAERHRNRVQQDLIQLARVHLAGKRITVRPLAKHLKHATKARIPSAKALVRRESAHGQLACA